MKEENTEESFRCERINKIFSKVWGYVYNNFSIGKLLLRLMAHLWDSPNTV